MLGLPMVLILLATAGWGAAGLCWLLLSRRVGRLRGDINHGAWVLAEARAEQTDRQAMSRMVLDHSSDVIVRMDRQRQPDFISPACQDVFGMEASALLGDTVEDRTGLHLALSRIDTAELGQETTWALRHANGSPVWIEARLRDLAPHRGIVAVLRDHTKHRRAEDTLTDAMKHLTRAAMQDSLTGLPNRTCFLETTERMLAAAAPCAVLFIDLDGFKAVNDVHGHPVGDTMLREIGSRLARELANEPIVARLGADEFAAVLRVTDDDTGIAARARDVLRVLSDPIQVGAMTLDVSAAIGISVGPRDGTDATSILRTADIAMAYAKAEGGGCYRFFERRMSEDLMRSTELKGELRGAIEAGEIVPYFQPLVRLDSTTIVGFEVLARWEHPVHGLLPPVQFLTLVEEAGLSAAMFGAILSAACAAARDWPAELRFSVNISPHELQDESLPEDVRQILERHGMDGTRLEIEITENALIHDSRIARGVVDALREQGVSVALDDFGTGFSSLYHLRELPFDKLKIDKSFMRALDTDADSARYVAAIIGLGHALGLELTAEGIEDEATMLRLRELGCTFGQGYLFGRPTPASGAAALLYGGGVKALAAE